MNPELERQVEKRKQDAINKRICKKAMIVIEHYGIGCERSLRDEELFTRHLWKVESGGLNIRCHPELGGPVSIHVTYNGRVVFDARHYWATVDEIYAYIPGDDTWEKGLEELSSPLIEAENEVQRRKEARETEEEMRIRKRFGL